MQFLEKPWKMLENTDIKLITTEARRNYVVSEPNYHRTKSKNLLAVEMRKTQTLINKPVYLGLLILESCCCHLNSYIAPVSSKKFLDIQATKECRFTVKRVLDIITSCQMHRTDKYSQHSSIIWAVWLNG